MNRHERRAAQAQHKGDGLVKIPLIIGHDMRTMLGDDAIFFGKLAVDRALDSCDRQLPITGQHSFTVFINAANGTEMKIIVALDNEKQTLACGFPSDFNVVDKEAYEAHYANRENQLLVTVEIELYGKVLAFGGAPDLSRAMAARVAELTNQPAPEPGTVLRISGEREEMTAIAQTIAEEFPTLNFAVRKPEENL